MLVNGIVDLVVLGSAHKTPITVDSLVSQAKSLIPEIWQPTRGVVEASILRSINLGFLRLSKDQDEFLETTILGFKHVQSLMLYDAGRLNSKENLTVDAVQFCFLDIVDKKTACLVLQRLREKNTYQLSEFKEKLKHCRKKSRFLYLWMRMNRERLEGLEKILLIATEQAQMKLEMTPICQEVAE